MPKSFPEKPLIIRTKTAHLSAVHHAASGKKLVILCHGYTGSKIEHQRLMVYMGRSLQKAGINALRFDFMGSGDSSGEFNQMSPNTQIRDVLDVLAWSRRRGFKKIGLLGLSFGGGTVISAAYQARPHPNAMMTWSSVPSWVWWGKMPQKGKPEAGNPLIPGKQFYTDRPKVDIPDAFKALKIPRMQIQGDKDIPEFCERFAAFVPKNDPLARHLILPGADHVFTTWKDRQRVIAETTRFFKKHLA